MSPEAMVLNGIVVMIAAAMLNRWMNQVDTRFTNLEKSITRILVKLKIDEEADENDSHH